MYTPDKAIVLVGLMGVGKTSVGRRLAEMLGVPFCDSDDEIVEAAGMSIPEIFTQYGEAEFRRGETAVLSRLMQGPVSVVSTGGGAFINAENREAIEGAGISVWLNVPFEVLWSRIYDKPGRPLLRTTNPKQTLRDLYDSRNPVYATADITVEPARKDGHDDVAQMIVEALAAHAARPTKAET